MAKLSIITSGAEVAPDSESRSDSGRILRFSFRPGSEPGVKNCEKGVTFQFQQWQESLWSFLK